MVFGSVRVACACLFACLAVLGVSAPAHAALEVGDQAPDFELAGSDGRNYRLTDLRGRHVVIAFFPKAYTSGCTIECKALRDSGQEIGRFDVAYFMASTDSLEDNRGFAENNDAPFPILADPDKTMCGAFGVLSERGYANRWTYYIDPQGVVVKIDRSVNPRTAGADLVANLQALGVPAVD